MMKQYCESRVVELALARAKVAELKANYGDLEQAFEEQPHVAQLLDELSRQQEIQSNAELRLRAHAVALFKNCGEKKPHPAVEIRLVRKMEYPEHDAREFCMDHFSSALKLDRRLWEKYARDVADTNPICFVKFTQEPQVMIARDLSTYVGEPGE